MMLKMRAVPTVQLGEDWPEPTWTWIDELERVEVMGREPVSYDTAMGVFRSHIPTRLPFR